MEKNDGLPRQVLLLCGFLALFLAAPVLAQSLVATLPLPGVRSPQIEIYEPCNRLFVVDYASWNVLVYDTGTLESLGTLDLAQDIIGIGIYEPSGKLYACIDDVAAGKYRTAVFDACSGQMIHIIEGMWCGDLKDEQFGRIYSFPDPGNLLGILEVATDTARQVPISGGSLRGSADVNPVTHEIFVGYRNVGIGEKMDIIDGQTLSLKTVQNPAVYTLLADWLQNKVFMVANTWDHYVYDRETDSGHWIEGCSNDGTYLYFDQVNDRVLTDSEVNGDITFFDGATDSCFNLPMYSPTYPLDFRRATDHIYLGSRTRSLGQGHDIDVAGILDGRTLLFQNIPLRLYDTSSNSEWQIAVHQSAGRVFLLDTCWGKDELTSLFVVQDSDFPERPPLYLQRSSYLWSFDPVSGSIIDKSFRPCSTKYCLLAEPGGGKVYDPVGNIWAGALYEGPMGQHSAIGDSLALSLDGRSLYVALSTASDGLVKKLDIASNTIVATADIGRYALFAAATPDGSKLYVSRTQETFYSSNSEDQVSVIDLGTFTPGPSVTTGQSPWGIAINPSGKKVYVANAKSNTVSVIDADTDTVIKTVPVGRLPKWLAFSADGKWLFVSNRQDGTVSVLDAGSDGVVGTLTVGQEPEGIAAHPFGGKVYVNGASEISVIGLPDFSVSSIPLGGPNAHGPIVMADPTSRFAGRVLIGESPARGAVVSVYQNRGKVASAESDASGDYCLANLRPGTYEIEAVVQGYPPQSHLAQVGQAGRITLAHFAFQPAVPGDCDGDGKVLIGEVQKAINMFLGTLSPGCGADCDGDGSVSIGEVQKVINAFLGTSASC